MSLVLVVIEVVFIVSEKVTEIDDEIETEVSESEGEVDDTVGGLVSELESPTSSFFSPHERKKKEMIRIEGKRIFIKIHEKLKVPYLNNTRLLKFNL